MQLRSLSGYLALILVAVILVTGCATPRVYRALEKDEQEVYLAVGGPMFNLGGVPLFAPFSNLGYRRGINDKLSYGIGLPLTAFLYQNFAVDAYLIYFVTEKFAVQPEIMFVADMEGKASRLYPMFSAWRPISLSENLYLAPGISSLYQAKAPYLFVSPFVAVIKNLGEWDLSFEFSYLAPHLGASDYMADFITLGNGSAAVYFGVTRKF